MDNGWIKLHRRLLENPIIKHPNYFTLWMVLLMLANHKENKFMWNGGVIIVKEGQLITGRKKLAELTGITESTIENILKYLESEHQIEQQKTTKFRLITVINWKKFQNSDNTSDNKVTTNQQQTDTNNNDKNVKNDKKKSSEPSSEVSKGVNKILDVFQTINPGINYAHSGHRKSAMWLIGKFGVEKAVSLAVAAVGAQGQKYAPTITNPTHLKEKLGELNIFYGKENNKITPIV